MLPSYVWFSLKKKKKIKANASKAFATTTEYMHAEMRFSFPLFPISVLREDVITINSDKIKRTKKSNNKANSATT